MRPSFEGFSSAMRKGITSFECFSRRAFSLSKSGMLPCRPSVPRTNPKVLAVRARSIAHLRWKYINYVVGGWNKSLERYSQMKIMKRTELTTKVIAKFMSIYSQAHFFHQSDIISFRRQNFAVWIITKCIHFGIVYHSCFEMKPTISNKDKRFAITR